MPPETLPQIATVPSEQKTAPSAPASNASAPATQDTNQGTLQGTATAQANGAAAMTPQAKLEARQKIAADIASRSAGTASDRGTTAGGTQGSQAQPGRPGDLKPQAGVSTTTQPNTTTTPPGTAGAPAQDAVFTFGKITGLNAQQFEAAIQHEQRLQRELGPIGSKLAKGEALTPAEVQALAEHTANRAANLAAQSGKQGTAKATTQAAGTGESQTPQKTGERGKTPAGKPPSPGTDGLDAALDTLSFYNDEATGKIRTTVEGMRAKLTDAETRLAEFEAKESQRREQMADHNTAAATQALVASFPELRQPGVLTAVLDQMEKFDPTFALAEAGGPEFLELFENAAKLAILPQRLSGHRASLLDRTASERAGAPTKPTTSSNAISVTSYTPHQARAEIAKICSTMPQGPDRDQRIRSVKELTVA